MAMTIDRVNAQIEFAQTAFRNMLIAAGNDGGLTTDRYTRFLSMQHHLTKGVQRHFLIAASHPDLARRRKLRGFLVRFANEEELHFEIARQDLDRMEAPLLPRPFDVALWWAYFDSIIDTRPF